MTATMFENDILELLDFDHGIACDAPFGNCDSEAKYHYKTHCCGVSRFWCEACKQLLFAWVKSFEKVPMAEFGCKNCGITIPASADLYVYVGLVT